jgi:hypothetical protein
MVRRRFGIAVMIVIGPGGIARSRRCVSFHESKLRCRHRPVAVAVADFVIMVMTEDGTAKEQDESCCRNCDEDEHASPPLSLSPW